MLSNLILTCHFLKKSVDKLIYFVKMIIVTIIDMEVIWQSEVYKEK